MKLLYFTSKLDLTIIKQDKLRYLKSPIANSLVHFEFKPRKIRYLKTLIKTDHEDRIVSLQSPQAIL